ncbi:MAG: DNA polymerase IV [Chloroflexi bacterium]|nr:DNA polymerase IV [Chloroflexota bacterium]
MPSATILHADLDAFFAAVEQRDNPELRGRPVIVGGKQGQRGVVTSPSYEARRFGVHSAMPSATAKRLCPEAVFVRPRHAAYSAVSDQIMNILRSVTPLVEPLSLDEAFLDVAGCERSLGTPVEIARIIKGLVLREERLTISIGIATSKSVAKIASDLSKPDGLLVVPVGTEREFLAPLPVGKVWGVGPKTRSMLENIGIRTIGDLANQKASGLSAKLGRNGHRIRRLAVGIDERSIEPDPRRKSLGHETTFDLDVRDPSTLRAFLLEASEKVAKRLRTQRIRGRVVTLKLRYADFTTITRRRTLDTHSDEGRVIYKTATGLLDTALTRGSRFRLAGVHVSDFSRDDMEQLPLDWSQSLRNRRLDLAVDAIAERFGPHSVSWGRLVGTAAQVRPAG